MKNKGHYCYKTSIGKVREINEDQAIVLTNVDGDVLMLICDGMGGHKKGDVASKMAIEMLAHSFREKQKFICMLTAKQWFQRMIKKANRAIHALANKNPECLGMGTTLVGVLLRGNQFIVANMGDSRAYILEKDRLVQITEDQTYVEHLYRIGKITKEEMKTHPKRHILTNALGIFPTVNLELTVHKYNHKKILLCSDGLYNNINEEELFALLTSNETLVSKCDEALKRVDDNGGSDNSAIAFWEGECDENR